MRKMCDFCENIKEYDSNKDFHLDDGVVCDKKTNRYYIVCNDSWEDYCEELEVKFCPLCGRKLSEEIKEL